ncbi:MAG TPA: tetratricopeptide repeat protein [Magnetospirillum sp.]|nr:tetratricopeptide repeat protein [Magnetospirillum sp.]
MDVAALLEKGLACHAAGQLGDAARCYRAVLEREPDNPDALNLMSSLVLMTGDAAQAANLAAQAIRAQPDWFAPYIALGNALQSAGRADQAADMFREALRLNPRSAEAHCNLSSAFNALGRFDEAVMAAVEAIVLNGELVQAHTNFGNALMGLGNAGEAVEAFLKVVALTPEDAEGWYNLGSAYAALDQPEEAVASLRRSAQLRPSAPAFYNLGNVLLRDDRPVEAEAAFRAAADLAPDWPDVPVNLAAALADQGRVGEAEGILRHVAAIIPDMADAHFNLALLLLRQGRFQEGWKEYEWRWQRPDFQPLRRPFVQPQWDGGELAGRTLLITAEQGFGDALQHCRFIAEVARRGARVVLECRPGLTRLLAGVEGVAEVVELGAELPSFDLHVPLLSLPHLLGVAVGDLPGRVPYLAVPPGTDDFADFAAGSEIKVGLVWAGSASRDRDRRRSLSPADLAPLLAVPGCRFHSLQVDGEPAPAPVVTLVERLGDFADTAAAVAALDVVISVDTAVAHLAGALGKPVWVMLSTPCDGFLWMDGRDDSPWYPSARLFRQERGGDWGGVVAAVAHALAGFTRS